MSARQFIEQLIFLTESNSDKWHDINNPFVPCLMSHVHSRVNEAKLTA